MPAGSIMNGCTGGIRPVQEDDYELWRRVIQDGSDPQVKPYQAAKRTAGRHLHCVEFWMPGKCNLHCRHCYVASRPQPKALREDEYYSLTSKLVGAGFIDVVVPGMEPLLRRELWPVLEAARDAGARSVGLTTNATLLTRHAKRLHDSSLTVLNVSLDGPRHVHDSIRGEGVFDQLEHGVSVFRSISDKRVLTNTTVNAANLSYLADIAAWSLQSGIDFSAFHPFEMADEAENSLAVELDAATEGYEKLFIAFMRGQTSSIVLEAEASTFSVIVKLAQRGLLNSAELVIDEAGFLFLRETCGARQLLVGLNFYPHHFIRTIRVTDDGGISSCRSMARTGWHGIGDLRRDRLADVIRSTEALQGLALIWDEFQTAQDLLEPSALAWFLDFVGTKVRPGQSIEADGCRPPAGFVGIMELA